jgi:hypothetical protein
MTGTKHVEDPEDAEVAQLAAELAAGRLTTREAIDRLVDRIAAGAELDPDDRAELRALLADLIEYDPHLGAIAARV